MCRTTLLLSTFDKKKWHVYFQVYDCSRFEYLFLVNLQVLFYDSIIYFLASTFKCGIFETQCSEHLSAHALLINSGLSKLKNSKPLTTPISSRSCHRRN